MKIWIACLATVTMMVAALASADARQQTPRSTIVLVHGAFAESGSWNGVIERLRADGYTVIAASNPLRGVASDAASVAGVVNSVTTPVVLVGHSYGGPIIPELGTHAGVQEDRRRRRLACRDDVQPEGGRRTHRGGRRRPIAAVP